MFSIYIFYVFSSENCQIKCRKVLKNSPIYIDSLRGGEHTRVFLSFSSLFSDGFLSSWMISTWFSTLKWTTNRIGNNNGHFGPCRSVQRSFYVAFSSSSSYTGYQLLQAPPAGMDFCVYDPFLSHHKGNHTPTSRSMWCFKTFLSFKPSLSHTNKTTLGAPGGFILYFLYSYATSQVGKYHS